MCLAVEFEAIFQFDFQLESIYTALKTILVSLYCECSNFELSYQILTLIVENCWQMI
jgi:hypothetical protein